jgi:MYXO-CTERM domain-containing protein
MSRSGCRCSPDDDAAAAAAAAPLMLLLLLLVPCTCPSTPSLADGMQDMIDLAFLHEPGVLWNLKQRYLGNSIYTYTGSILIAVNPFQSLPGLYGRSVMDSYSSGDATMLPPHVYAIAAAAYKKMRQEGRGQAILVRAGPLWLLLDRPLLLCQTEQQQW